MRVLFCNIAWMKYYKGDAYGNDHPQGGGSYVVEHQEAHEEFNFHPVELSGGEEIEEGEYCLGFVETKRTNHETDNQLKIEKISGCSLCTKEDFVEDVTVVYCARYPWSDKRETVIVGWFRNATVLREYQWVSFEERLGRKNHVQGFNAIARSDNCVLLPVGERRQNRWNVPRKSAKYANYGFGQSNVWYANDPENEDLQKFLNRIEKEIDTYSGENWLYRYPEDK